MKKGLLIGLLCGVALVGLSGYIPSAGAASEALTPTPEPPVFHGSISVSGTGEVSVVPDVAILNLGVEAQAEKVGQAMDQAAAAMDRVMATLKANGVAEDDIQTQYFNIYPVTRWTDREEILVGYRVTNMANVKIRQMDSVGTVIDAVAEAGGDLTRIHGVTFTVDDPSQYEEEARARAVADAMSAAGQLAELSGVNLGKPTSISESGGYTPYYWDYNVRYSMEGAASAVPTTPISPGETKVMISVHMTFATH